MECCPVPAHKHAQALCINQNKDVVVMHIQINARGHSTRIEPGVFLFWFFSPISKLERETAQGSTNSYLFMNETGLNSRTFSSSVDIFARMTHQRINCMCGAFAPAAKLYQSVRHLGSGSHVFISLNELHGGAQMYGIYFHRISISRPLTKAAFLSPRQVFACSIKILLV